MNKEYTYYCRLRPPAPGCQPKNTLSIDYNPITVNGRDYWGSVTYNRPLTDEEIYNYDLDYITDYYIYIVRVDGDEMEYPTMDYAMEIITMLTESSLKADKIELIGYKDGIETLLKVF